MDWQNPGPHVTIADNLTDTQIANIQEEYKARKTVWDFQSNVNRAIIASLNLADTHTYCWVVAGAIGMRNYRFTDDPKDIVQVLQDNCGQMKPAEKTKIEADWSAAWNPLEPIKLLFDQLGCCYMLSVAAKPAYTQEKMINKALTAIQRTGLYTTAILEYQSFPTENQKWAEFKHHCAEAYMIRLQSGQSGGNPYHGAANEYDNNDNDSITTLHNTLAKLTHASNSNTNELSKKIASMAHEMTALHTTVEQQAQQLANITTTPTVANPVWSAPTT